MLRIADTLRSKGKPSVNYEFVASQEFNAQPQKYALLNQVLQVKKNSINTVEAGLRSNQTTFGSHAPTGFGQPIASIKHDWGLNSDF
jgi:hypothetical protein